jgi:hypothetical protein
MKAKKNCMGTITFEYKFAGMRLSQEFDVYPIDKKSTDKVVTIQSNTRIGKINLENGNISLSKHHSGGAYFHHLSMDTLSESILPAEDLQTLRDAIIGTSGELVGNNGIIFCDNSNAATI